MRPLIRLTVSLFEKGEALTREDNAEPAVWWYLTYAYIYGLDDLPRKDESLLFYKLPKEKEFALRYKMADYVIRLGGIWGQGSRLWALHIVGDAYTPCYEF